MTEPARFLPPRPRPRPAVVFDPPPPPTPAERFAQRMRALPTLPSREALLALTDNDLPTTDGLVPPDVMYQEKAITYTLVALRWALRHHPEAYVSGYTLVYDAGRPDEEGRSSPTWVVPDVLVAYGVGDNGRLSYVMWREGKPPDFVLEVASMSTWRRDRDEKPEVYEALGVKEYFLFDPMGGLLEPRLQGHVLRDGAFRRLELERLPNAGWGLRSEVLGLWAYLKGPGQALRWHDPATGKEIEDVDEVIVAREAAEARAAEEAAARKAAEARAAEAAAACKAAEAEVAELRAQLQRLRREP